MFQNKTSYLSLKSPFSFSRDNLKVVFIILLISFTVASFDGKAQGQDKSLEKTKFRHTITYNADGSATIVSETEWKKTDSQKNGQCPFFDERKTQTFKLITKTVEEKKGKCVGYSLIYIPQVIDKEFLLTDLPTDVTSEQLIEGMLIKLKSNVRNIAAINNPSNPVTLTYILPRIINAEPVPTKKRETRRFSSITWRISSANTLPDLQISGTLQRKPRLCETPAVPDFVLVNPNETWESIIRKIEDYHNNVIADLKASIDGSGNIPRNKLSALIFALQIEELAKTAYQNRTEKGGWAGDFVRTVLSVSASDIRRRLQFWVNNHGGCLEASKNENPFVCDLARLLPGKSGVSYCNARLFGDEHFESHLKAGFYSAIKRALITSLLDSTKEGDRVAKLAEAYNKIVAEHEALINKAIRPGFKSIEQQMREDFKSQNRTIRAGLLERKIIPRVARFLVPEQVRLVRFDVLLDVTADLTRERVITAEESRVFQRIITGRKAEAD